MLYLKSLGALSRRHSTTRNFVFITSLLLLAAFETVSAQTYRREMDTSDRVSLSVKSRNGRVSVIASDDQQKKVTIEASSTGALLDPNDVHAVAKANLVDIEVHDRRDQDRIDLIVHIPSRSKVRIETAAGAV